MATELEKRIRKLRRKLRQIENLESCDKKLNRDELMKIRKKEALRTELLDLLTQLPEDYNQSFSDSSPTKQSGGYDSGDMSEYASNESHNDIPHLSEEEEEEDDYEYEDEPEISDDISEDEGAMDANIEEKMEKPVAPSNIVVDCKKASVKRSNLDTAQPNTSIEQSTGSSKKAKTSEKESDSYKPTGLVHKWKSMTFETSLLKGHNDIVCCVATDGNIAITGSRDTMVKVWSLKNGKEVKSFGGHTGTVTSVLLLTQAQAAATCKYHGLPESILCISGSSDCCIKIWHLSSGQLVKSVYTYNPVTCLRFLDDQGLLIAGSGGGKIDLWSPETGNCVQSTVAHEDAVTEIQVENNFVYSSSVDGVIKVFELRESKLHPVFVSEDVKLEGSPRSSIIWRHIRSMAVKNQNIYFGDEGMNVKVISWKKGSIRKLNNNASEFGVTDAIAVHKNLLLCSGYDLDNGIGYVNVRSVNDEKYLATLSDDDTPRILCVACQHTENGKLQILTGGFELKLWQQIDPSSNHSEKDNIMQTRFITRYGGRVRHSDIDSDTDLDLSESDLDVEDLPRNSRRNSALSDASNKGWLSWCVIL